MEETSNEKRYIIHIKKKYVERHPTKQKMKEQGFSEKIDLKVFFLL